MTHPQRFTDEQTREILSAAADRQAEADRAGPLVAGSLSLPEIQAIAEEVGIDREHVAHAAREILARGGSPSAVALREGKGVHLARTVPSTVTDSEWGRVVAELCSTFEVVGVSSEIGEVREWLASSSLKGGGVRVRLEPTSGGTGVTIEDSLKTMRDLRWVLPGTSGALTAAVATLTTAASTAAPAQAGLLAFLGGLTVASLVGTQIGGRMYRGRQERRIRTLLDRIDLALRSEEDDHA